jgi:MerR family transcriptional regulator, thiopeptide resistance regulator
MATGAGPTWSVGEVAAIAHVTVRALHHYDEIGLLRPGARTPSGHRRYDSADLDRLQQLLFYRELGFPLEQVAELLDRPGLDPLEHLSRQHALLEERAARLRAMADSVARTIQARRAGISLTPEEMFDVFADFDPTQYADEARERWGDTDAYRQSQQRTQSYGKADWEQVQAEQTAVTQRLAAAMAAGLPADSAEAMDAAEEHRQHISRRFYDCGYDIHRGLAQMYVADERFTRHYEDVAPGLARYVHDAILANADRAGA